MRRTSSIRAGFIVFVAVLLLMAGCGGAPPTNNNQNACTTATAPVLPALAAPNGSVGSAYTFTSAAVTGGVGDLGDDK